MSLSEKLLDPSVRPAVAADLARVIDDEVKGKSGMSGMAIKGAYSAAKKKVDVASALNSNMEQVTAIFDPYWEQFGGQGDFGAYLAEHGDAVTADILKVADARAAASSRDQVAKVYQSMRGKASEHVKAALPAVGACLQKHAV